MATKAGSGKKSGAAPSSDHMSKTTIDHDVIRHWVEERGGSPDAVEATGSGNDIGIIRIDFPGYSGEGSLIGIEWDEFFDKFEASNLAFLYQERTKDGALSNFNKFISRDSAELSE